MPDEAALIFARRGVVLVHTSTANAGIFTVADVYRLSRSPGAPLDRRLVHDEDLSHMLDLALSAYDTSTGRCADQR